MWARSVPDRQEGSQMRSSRTLRAAACVSVLALAHEGMTMVVVTHEMGFARKAANRVVFMADGEIVEQAPPHRFFENPQSERARDFLSKVLTH